MIKLKNSIKLTMFALVMLGTTTLFNSCKEDDSLIQKEYNSEAIEQMKIILKEKYDITLNYHGNDEFEFFYPDERVLIIEKEAGSESRIISGSKINNEKIRIDFNNDVINPDGIMFTDVNTGEKINKQDFIQRINDLSEILNNGVTMKPCGEYPDNVTFDDCFATEWNEFCDGVIGCLALGTNPVPVAIAFAIHCTACVSSKNTHLDPNP